MTTADSATIKIKYSHLLLSATWVILTLCGSLAYAQVVNDPPISDPEPLIEVTDDEPADSRIQTRIKTIFTKIEGLQWVEVSVNAGVVQLSGDVSNEALARDAMDIAIRTAGVVTVADKINRTLDVENNVRPLIKGFTESIHAFTRALPLITLALVILIAFIFLATVIARWSSLWNRITPNPFMSQLLAQAMRIGVIAIGVVLALNLLGASKFITTIIGGAGVLGIAIGFAVRDSLENYISSIMLSLRQPFRANDHVLINEHEGIVVRLTSRATILMTLDGNHLRIPNAIVFKGIILNYTTNPERRFAFLLGVDADDDPLGAMQVGLNAINQHPSILKDPKAAALIDSVGDSSIIIKFTGWVDQLHTDFAKARSVAIKAAKTALEDNGFTLPEPIYRLRFDNKRPQLQTTESVDSATAPKQSAVSAKVLKLTEEVGQQVDQAPMDVSADNHLQKKIGAERAKDSDKDLLDPSQPIE